MSNSAALQRTGEAIAQIVEASAAVQGVTARITDNIVRYRNRAPARLPLVAYLCTDARQRNGVGDNWDVDVTLQAEADKAADANALLAAAVDSLTVQAFADVGADAVLITKSLKNLPDDGDPPSTNPAAVLAEAELTIWITL